MHLLKKCRETYRRFRHRQYIARQINPKALLCLAQELRELALQATQTSSAGPDFQQRLSRIIYDMEQLDALARKPEFKQLTPEKRRELRKNILLSREHILDTLCKASPPTSVFQ